MKFNQSDIQCDSEFLKALEKNLFSIGATEGRGAEFQRCAPGNDIDLKGKQLILVGPVDCDDCVNVNLQIPRKLMERLDNIAAGPHSVLVEMALEYMVESLLLARNEGASPITIDAFDLQSMFGDQTKPPAALSGPIEIADNPPKISGITLPRVPKADEKMNFQGFLQSQNRQSYKTAQSQYIRAPQFRRRATDQ